MSVQARQARGRSEVGGMGMGMDGMARDRGRWLSLTLIRVRVASGAHKSPTHCQPDRRRDRDAAH